MIPERSVEVLRAIVQDYIETSQPVGSKALVDRHGFSVSAATIRNDMAILEEEELIVVVVVVFEDDLTVDDEEDEE
jgi:heat-inducible transcriptional repressor